jgi:hypothetical protein
MEHAVPPISDHATHGVFSLVVVGAMNPALHHPQWYESIGCISAAEVDEALARQFLFINQVTQFDSGAFEVFCDPNRWQITTRTREAETRIVEIMLTVFDKRLTETPVTALGISRALHASTSTADVAKSVSSLLTRLPSGFHGEPSSTGKITFVEAQPSSEHVERARLRWEIEPSASAKDSIYLGANLELVLGSTPVPSRFELNTIVTPRLPGLTESVAARIKSVVAAIDAEGGA